MLAAGDSSGTANSAVAPGRGWFQTSPCYLSKGTPDSTSIVAILNSLAIAFQVGWYVGWRIVIILKIGGDGIAGNHCTRRGCLHV